MLEKGRSFYFFNNSGNNNATIAQITIQEPASIKYRLKFQQFVH